MLIQNLLQPIFLTECCDTSCGGLLLSVLCTILQRDQNLSASLEQSSLFQN